MQLIVNADGIDVLRARVADARAALGPLLQQTARDAGDWVAQNLSDAAPVGKAADVGTPPGSDAPGRLSESFFVQDEGASETSAAITVRTKQPTKLKFVVYGTGVYGPVGQRIRPTTAKALFWPGADHPVKSVAGMKPNDFVTPALQDMPTADEALGMVVDELAAILEGE